MDVSAAEIVDPETSPALDKYIADLVEARKKKVRRRQPRTLHGRINTPVCLPVQCAGQQPALILSPHSWLPGASGTPMASPP